LEVSTVLMPQMQVFWLLIYDVSKESTASISKNMVFLAERGFLETWKESR